MLTTYFGQCGRHQELKRIVEESAAMHCAATVPQMHTCIVLGVLSSFLFCVSPSNCRWLIVQRKSNFVYTLHIFLSLLR